MPRDATARRFAALGDPLRLDLLERIGASGSASISQLSGTAPVSRQAVTKHLSVLENAELIRGERHGREHRWSVNDHGWAALAADTERMAAQWRQRLARLKLLVEDDPPE